MRKLSNINTETFIDIVNGQKLYLEEISRKIAEVYYYFIKDLGPLRKVSRKVKER